MTTPKYPTVVVPVQCQHVYDNGRRCDSAFPYKRSDFSWHVHQPPPCENGADDRHHDFEVPAGLRIIVAGQSRFVRGLR